ncbi:MAG: hypothetical protein J6Z17_03225 [Treponema sp.]|nr:hypothetical protein [Treponema sp.]
MKKILSWLSAALIIAGTFAFTGCDEVAKEVLNNEGVWFKYTVKYDETDDPNSGSSLICYILYTDNEYKNSNLSAKAYTNGTDGSSTGGSGLAAGLTLVVKNDSGSKVGKLANNTYAIHTFEKDKKVSSTTTVEGDDLGAFSNFTVGSTLWNAFYLYNIKDLERQSGVPAVISKEFQNTFTPVKDFSWKKILGQLLVDNLLE